MVKNLPVSTLFMTISELFLSAVLALPLPSNPYHWEDPIQRKARVEEVARQAWTVAEQNPMRAWSTVEGASLIVTVLWHESGRFDIGTYTGLKRGDHGHSVCYGQINRGAWPLIVKNWNTVSDDPTPAFPAGLLGGTGVKACITSSWIVLREWSGCGGDRSSVQGAASILMGYGTGRTCRPGNWALNRAFVWNKLVTSATIEPEI